MATRAEIEAAYLEWFKSVDDPIVKLEIARLAQGAFDEDEDEPSAEVLELLVEKENWEELERLGYIDLCPDWYSEEE